MDIKKRYQLYGHKNLTKLEVLEHFEASTARIVASYEAIPALQQELFQEIYTALWLSMELYRSESSLQTYLYRIAHNVAVGHVKKSLREVETDTIALEAEQACNNSPEESYERSVEQAELFRAIRELKIDDRQIMVLALEGESYADISNIVGLSENNVAVRVNRAKKKLREILEV